MTLALATIAIVLGVLAIAAWASAWKTLEWLADAEDLIDVLRSDEGRPAWPTRLLLELEGYRRRSPRRRS